MTKVNLPSTEQSPVSFPQRTEGARRTSKVGEQVTTDQITTSEGVTSRSDSAAPVVSTADQPNLYPSKTISREEIDEGLAILKNSGWFKPSFLGAFIAIMQDIANYERLNHLQESQVEIKMRDYLFKMAQANSELTTALYEQQSFEKITEAFTNFASAAISGIQFVQTTRNLGKATAQVDQRIETKSQEVKTQKLKEADVQTADSQTDIQRKLTTQEQRGYSGTVKKLEKELNKMEQSRQSDIQTALHHEDQKSNQFGEVLKQTIQGTSGIVQSQIKLEQGEIDSLKQLTEGFIQAFNKYSETASRQRDDSKAAFDRNYDFTNRIIETTFRFQSLSHSN